MNKLFAYLVFAVAAISFGTSFMFHHAGKPIRHLSRLNTFYDRQSPNNKDSKPDPKKKKVEQPKWNEQMKSAFTPSQKRTCADEMLELSIDTSGKDFSAKTSLGKKLSQKV